MRKKETGDFDSSFPVFDNATLSGGSPPPTEVAQKLIVIIK